MIIRAYVRHYVGEYKSVFICGILNGGIGRHYVRTNRFRFIFGRGLSFLFCSEGAFKFYFVKRLNFEFISEGGFESYFVGLSQSNLFLSFYHVI